MRSEDLFINQTRKLPGNFQYVLLTGKFKTQANHIWDDYLGQESVHGNRSALFKNVRKVLCRELGVKSLMTNPPFHWSDERELDVFFEQSPDLAAGLTTIQLIFLNIEYTERLLLTYNTIRPQINYTASQAVADLNRRFIENGIGYQYTDGLIVKLENELLHQETVRHVLDLLKRQEFLNVNNDYLDALDHYRNGKLDDCFNDCLKAFESTMKIICELKGWQHAETVTAKPLILVLIQHNFLPLYHENQLNALKLLLESSVPTIRNKNSGHGSGNKQVIINPALASYMLYTTGATIRLLVETYYEGFL